MSFKPRTSSEINLFNIERSLSKLKKGTVSPNEVSKDLNWRFGRLKNDNIGMHEELYPKYVDLMKF